MALLSARQPRRRAVVQSCLAFDCPGMPCAVNAAELVEWGVLAVVGGALLGSVFADIGNRRSPRRDRPPRPRWACRVADAYRRARGFLAEDQVAIGFAVLPVRAVLAVAVRIPRQLLVIAAWSLPAGVIGYGLVSVPDALEQLLITGGL